MAIKINPSTVLKIKKLTKTGWEVQGYFPVSYEFFLGYSSNKLWNQDNFSN